MARRLSCPTRKAVSFAALLCLLNALFVFRQNRVKISLDKEEARKSTTTGNVVPNIREFLALSSFSTNDHRGRDWVNGEIKDDVGEECSHGVIIDILSVGTETRPEYQRAQATTFATHPCVRKFIQVNENDDYDTSATDSVQMEDGISERQDQSQRKCHRTLTASQLEKIVSFCKRKPPRIKKKQRQTTLDKLRWDFARYEWLMLKKDPVGLMCAQKRPIYGLFKLFNQYRERNKMGDIWSSLPDYVLLIDDDTYVNLFQDGVLGFWQEAYPPRDAYVVAGCLCRKSIPYHNFTYPYGGFGTLMTKAAVYNWLRPIDCPIMEQVKKPSASPSSLFLQNACDRLSENSMFERAVYEKGDSVIDIMYKYAIHAPFEDVAQWYDAMVTDGEPALDETFSFRGYCLHSDVALGYFVNFYNIAMHSADPVFTNVAEDRFVGYNGSVKYFGPQRPRKRGKRPLVRSDPKQCLNSNNTNCDPNTAHFCHLVTPEHMRFLHKAVS